MNILKPAHPEIIGAVSDLDAMRMFRLLRPAGYRRPRHYGYGGYLFERMDLTGRIIISVSDYDGVDWIHASIAFEDHLPTYDDLKTMHAAVFPDGGWSYQVFAPASDHVNIHQFCLHLWGRLDGKPGLPDFTRGTGSV